VSILTRRTQMRGYVFPMRRYTLEEWMSKDAARAELARKFRIERPSVSRQPGKSREKKALLEQMYGPTGQPERQT
jgi:hypothetical protein